MPQNEQDGKIQIYNLPSKSLSWESSPFGYYINAVSIANLRSFSSNDLLVSATKMVLSMDGSGYKGDIFVFGCGQSTDTTTTTSAAPTSTTTTSIPGQTTTTTIIDEPCPVEELYGTDAPETALLRHVRDEILNKNREGKELIELYYAISPAVVEMLRSHDGLRDEARHLIDFIIREL